VASGWWAEAWYQDLLEDAALAEEVFDQHELEEFAEQARREAQP